MSKRHLFSIKKLLIAQKGFEIQNSCVSLRQNYTKSLSTETRFFHLNVLQRYSDYFDCFQLRDCTLNTICCQQNFLFFIISSLNKQLYEKAIYDYYRKIYSSRFI